MARIRTIKPEFPQSESMGRVSRDARLCFVQLWTLADDSGRLRGNSRMLASLLFPYDDDAKDLMDGWLTELESEGCIARYQVEGDKYIEIRKWLIHQKIDRPTPSKIPSFDESSRALANPREPSSLDQGPRTKDQGPKDQRPHDAGWPGFELFWACWPVSDRKQAKGKCLEAWKKAKAEPDAALIVAHVERMKASPDWRKDAGQFIPSPVVYVNQKRWEGALPTTAMDWWLVAGFTSVPEANNARCYAHNAHEFHDGKRIAEAA